MASSLSARQRLDQIWSNYRADPKFDALRAWKDPSLGPLNLVPGEGSVRPLLTVIGEAPGADEDRLGRPFVGASGQFLRRLLEEELGLVAEVDCWITNVVKYRPPGNATPNLRDRMNSQPYLQAELEVLVPRNKVVVPVGAVAWGVFPQSDFTGISAAEGRMWMGRNGWLIVPMFHPAYVLRSRGQRLEAYKRGFAVIREAMETPE